MTNGLGDVGPTIWLVGWNDPGYLPDAEPHRTLDWEEASEVMHDELVEAINSREARDGNYSADQLRTIGQTLLDATPGEPWEAEAHGVAYWIVREEG